MNQLLSTMTNLKTITEIYVLKNHIIIVI